jgi:hypothetical protein
MEMEGGRRVCSGRTFDGAVEDSDENNLETVRSRNALDFDADCCGMDLVTDRGKYRHKGSIAVVVRQKKTSIRAPFTNMTLAISPPPTQQLFSAAVLIHHRLVHQRGFL